MPDKAEGPESGKSAYFISSDDAAGIAEELAGMQAVRVLSNCWVVCSTLTAAEIKDKLLSKSARERGLFVVRISFAVSWHEPIAREDTIRALLDGCTAI